MAPEVPLQSARVCVLHDSERVSRAAATRFAQLAQKRVRMSGRCSVALSGGSTPRRLYELLASGPYRRRIPWDRVHLFWTDERCVPPGHPDSNFRMAQAALLAHVPAPAANIHRIPVEAGGPSRVAAAYARQLRTFFHLPQGRYPAFDLVLLGLGADGHTASLFPGSPALRATRRLAAAASGGRPRRWRVTLTLPVLTRARHALWLVTGAAKAAAVRAVLGRRMRRNPALPGRRVQLRRGTSWWLLDRAAAQGLRSRMGPMVPAGRPAAGGGR